MGGRQASRLPCACPPAQAGLTRLGGHALPRCPWLAPEAASQHGLESGLIRSMTWPETAPVLCCSVRHCIPRAPQKHPCQPRFSLRAHTRRLLDACLLRPSAVDMSRMSHASKGEMAIPVLPLTGAPAIRAPLAGCRGMPVMWSIWSCFGLTIAYVRRDCG